MIKASKAITFPPAIVFAVIMVLVLFLFFASRSSVDRDINNAISDYSQGVKETVKERFDIFDVTLRAGQGLLSGNPNATQLQWQEFVGTSTVLDRYASAKTINYAKVVNQEDIADFTNRADSLYGSTFKLQLDSANKSRYVVPLFTSPDNAKNRDDLGKDLLSNPSNKLAIERARDNGVITISGVDGKDIATEFTMFAPQYKAGMPTNTIQQRQEAIEGYTYAVFYPAAFAPNDAQKLKGIAYAVRNKDGKELYKSEFYDEISKGNFASKHIALDVADSPLAISYIYDPQALLPGYNVQLPATIVVFGSLLAVLVSFLVWLILASKARSLLLEQERGINDAKDSLLSLASHQLRTPATGVKQYLGLVLQGFVGDISPKQKEILEKANRSNERQLKTINDILYVARLGSGRIVLTKKLFSPTKLARDIVRDMDDSVKERLHKIKIVPQKKDKLFYGDEHMVRMAIENLISNAVKYTHQKGEITLTVSGVRELKISVQDNGVGVPEDKKEQLFKQFSRIDNELSVSVGGTGIGLYVVKNIANLHGGTVEVDSQQGVGSCFTIILPYIKPPKV